MGFLFRHWRGELSLPVAFWVNNFLLLLPLGLALGLVMAWAAAWGQGLQQLALVSLVGTLVLVGVSIWAPVGAWRSATHYLDEGGSTLWGLAAKLVLGLSLLGSLASFAFDVLPKLSQQWQLATGHDPIGELDIALSEDGRSVTLHGPFGMGASTRFMQAVKNAPQLHRVLLDSPGGRLYEAHEIATEVRRRGLQARATGDCASACTLVFVAGSRRSLAAHARLGFHRASVASVNPLHDELANRKLAQLYDEAGLPQDFVASVLRTPSRRMWFPSTDVLVAAGILGAPSLQPELDPDLPASAALSRYRDALADNPLWEELDRRKPGLLELAAVNMQRARRQGRSPEEAAQEAPAVAMGAVPTVLRSASAQAQEAYLKMLAAELRERRAAGDAACRSMLTNSAGTPPAPLWSWLQATLAEAAEADSPRALSPLELEVLQRELGAATPDRIRALLPAGGGAERPGCQRAIELLDAMARLRASQRRLAIRLMLHAPS